MSTFGDLLQRADRLLTTIGGEEAPSSSTFPNLDKNISRVFEQGERLWQKTLVPTTGAESSVTASRRTERSANSSLLWGPENVPSLKLPEKLQAAADAYVTADGAASVVGVGGGGDSADQILEETDLELFLRNERENILVNLINETIQQTSRKIEVESSKTLTDEWDAKKKKLISTFPTINTDDSSIYQKTFIYRSTPGIPGKSDMSDFEIRFAQMVSRYVDGALQGGNITKLVDMCISTVETLKSQKFNDLWQQVKIMMEAPLSINQNVFDQRKSIRFNIVSTNQALKYLEKQFVQHMQMIVHGSLEQARLGGVPGMANLVSAYLNIKFPSAVSDIPGKVRDGVIRGHPIWLFIFYCLRCGDFKSATDACTSGSPSVTEFGAVLKELVTGSAQRLSRETELKFNKLWRTDGRTSQDPFKIASFCTVGLCDTSLEHAEVANKFEDWLWIRLRQVLLTETVAAGLTTSDGAIGTAPSRSTDHVTSKLYLEQLRKQIFEDYGEKHFAGGDSPMIYWTALWLTGQFEAAIDFLYRQTDPLRCQAVHIALVAYESHLLLTSEDVQSKMCTPLSSGDTSVGRRLNLCRLILLYVSKFQTTNPRDAVDYFYFLKRFKNAANENMFNISLRDLLMETREFEMLLGYIEPNGARKLGLVDKYNICTDDLIAFLAKDAEQKGLMETAITFYDLAQNHSKTLQLLNESICHVASKPRVQGGDRDRVVNIALIVATRYRDTGHGAEPAIAATFYLLIDIVTFFDLFHENRYTDALEVIRRLKILPLSMDETDYYLKTFFMLSDEVKRTLPDLLMAVMTILSSEFKRIKGEFSFAVPLSQTTDISNNVKSSAKAIVTFVGMIPYRLPGDTVARLVQMETLMH